MTRNYYQLYHKYSYRYHQAKAGADSDQHRLDRIAEIHRIAEGHRDDTETDCGRVGRKRTCNRTDGCRWREPGGPCDSEPVHGRDDEEHKDPDPTPKHPALPEALDDDTTDCPICMEPETDESPLVDGCDNCDHQFHERCIMKYLTTPGAINQCPMCRSRPCRRNLPERGLVQTELIRLIRERATVDQILTYIFTRYRQYLIDTLGQQQAIRIIRSETEPIPEAIDFINQPDIHGRTPLYYSTRTGRGDIIANLLRFGADINYQDQLGETALYRAVSDNSLPLAQLLLDAGADPNIHGYSMDGGVSRVSMVAVRNQNIDMIRLLVQFGLDLAAEEQGGFDGDQLVRIMTPLRLAVTSGNLELVRWLFENGSNPTPQAIQFLIVISDQIYPDIVDYLQNQR
jgi:hypothetical protein